MIYYLHKFSWIFSQFQAIYFELFSSGVIFNMENTDKWGPPVGRRFLRRARLSARHRRVATTHPRRSRAFRALSRPRAGVPTALPTVPRCPRRRLASHAPSRPRARPVRSRLPTTVRALC
jgi:hypothetical protein